MSTPFLRAAQALVAANEQFAAGQLSPVGHRDARESAIAGALVAMAADMGVTLQAPMYVDSRGEFSIISMPPGGGSPKYGCGPYGEAFAAALSRHNPRTGVSPRAIMKEWDGWCHLNHFDAEKMVLEEMRAREVDGAGADHPRDRA